MKMFEDNFFGVIYDNFTKIKKGMIVEIFTEENCNSAYSHYVYITDIIELQQHKNEMFNFSVASVKGINVTDLYLSDFNKQEIDAVLKWVNLFK